MILYSVFGIFYQRLGLVGVAIIIVGGICLIAKTQWEIAHRLLLAIWSFENVRRPVTQNHEVVIFVIVTTILLLVVSTSESEVVGGYTALLL